MSILTHEVFTQWMEAIRQIVERAIPAVSLSQGFLFHIKLIV